MYNDFHFKNSMVNRNTSIEDFYKQPEPEDDYISKEENPTEEVSSENISSQKDEVEETAPVFSQVSEKNVFSNNRQQNCNNRNGGLFSNLFSGSNNIFNGISSFFTSIKEDDLVLLIVFLIIFNERNDDDWLLLLILAVLFFT